MLGINVRLAAARGSCDTFAAGYRISGGLRICVL